MCSISLIATEKGDARFVFAVKRNCFAVPVLRDSAHFFFLPEITNFFSLFFFINDKSVVWPIQFVPFNFHLYS